MDLFAPTSVPVQSGLSQPTMAPCRMFGVSAKPIHFGPTHSLRPVTAVPLPAPAPRNEKNRPPPLEPLLHAARLDRYDGAK